MHYSTPKPRKRRSDAGADRPDWRGRRTDTRRTTLRISRYMAERVPRIGRSYWVLKALEHAYGATPPPGHAPARLQRCAAPADAVVVSVMIPRAWHQWLKGCGAPASRVIEDAWLQLKHWPARR